MYLMHRGCGGVPRIDLSDSVKVIANFGIGNNGIRIGVAEIKQLPKKEINLEFVCDECGKKISLGEIVCQCDQCGETFTLEDAYLSENAGGTYCKQHIQEVDPSGKHTQISKILSEKLHI